MEVLVNFKNKLLAYAFCEILKKIENVIPYVPEEMKRKEPKIILTDYFSLDKEILSKYPKAKVILIDYGLKEKLLLRVLTQYKIVGIIAPYTDINLFKKALRVINEGQIWLDNRYLKHLLSGVEEVPFKDISLTHREKEIIYFVCQGLFNKEIADKLNISEQTVKAHLHRIFKKFGISNRAQLISIFFETNL
ncbi:MAG: response regulator transcription factor [Minisyncoccia bacterium]